MKKRLLHYYYQSILWKGLGVRLHDVYIMSCSCGYDMTNESLKGKQDACVYNE